MPEMTWTVVIGIIVGIFGRLVVRASARTGFLMTLVLAILGSFAGGFVAVVTGFARAGDQLSFACSALGALLFLFVRRMTGD